MNVSDECAKISNWLRFENCKPAWKPDIEAATGIALTPALIREGEVTGLFRLGPKGFF